MTTLGRRPMANGVKIQTQYRWTASECDDLLMEQMGVSRKLVLVVLVVVVESESRFLGKNLPAQNRHRLFVNGGSSALLERRSGWNGYPEQGF